MSVYRLDCQKAEAILKRMIKSHNGIINPAQTKQTEPTSPSAGTILSYNDWALSSSDDEQESPELKQYRYLEYVTTTLQAEPSLDTLSYWGRRNVEHKRKELLEVVELYKTALLQQLLENTLNILKLDVEHELLKKDSSSRWLKKLKNFVLHIPVVSTLCYGFIRGFLAVAGFVAPFVKGKNFIVMPFAALSAILFGVMALAFEATEIYKKLGLSKNSSHLTDQAAAQYSLIQAIATTVEEKVNSTNTADQQKQLQKTMIAVKKIHDIDTSKKINTAKTHMGFVNDSKKLRGLRRATTATLGLLNGASFSVLAFSLGSVILKCSVAALLSTAVLSTPIGIGVIVGALALFVAGVAVVGWAKDISFRVLALRYVTKAYETIAGKEAEDTTNTLACKINRAAQKVGVSDTQSTHRDTRPRASSTTNMLLRNTESALPQGQPAASAAAAYSLPTMQPSSQQKIKVLEGQKAAIESQTATLKPA